MIKNAQNQTGLEQSKSVIEKLFGKPQPMPARATITATDWDEVRKGIEKLFGAKA
jgi:hypothetical protein